MAQTRWHGIPTISIGIMYMILCIICIYYTMQHHIRYLYYITQYNNLPTISDVTEVISLCIHVRVQRYDGCVCVCVCVSVCILWCTLYIIYLRHGTGPPSSHRRGPTTRYTLGARESDGNRVSWSCTIVVLHGPPTQV